MTLPLVSVVIPCYNQGSYVRSAIRSAVATRAAVEVIVVDDGSTDDTAAVASALPGVRLVRQTNGGLASARNRGLQAATGEFIVFLDADDLLLPHAIDVGVRALQSDPDAVFAFGRCVMMGPEGERWPTPERPRVCGDVHDALLVTNPMWTPAVVMFRREAVVHAGGFRQGFDAAADYDLYLRLTSAGRAYDHGEVVAGYRRHPTSMSSRAARMLRETLFVLERHRPADPRRLALWESGLRQWRDFYGTQLVEEIRAHLRRAQADAAITKMLALLRLAPEIAAREFKKKLRVSLRLRAARPGTPSP